MEKYLRDSKILQLWEGGGQMGRIEAAMGYYEINEIKEIVKLSQLV